MYHTILSRLPSVDRFANLFIMFHLSRLLPVDFEELQTLCIMFLLSRMSSVDRVSVVSWSMMLHLSRLFYVLMYHVYKG